MRRAVARYLPREMAVLGLVEFTLSFAVIYSVIQAIGAAAALPPVIDMLPRGDIALAAVLAVIVAGVALIIGLYRPEVCLNRKRLLVSTGVIAIVTLTVLLFASGWPHASRTDDHSLYMAEALAAWLALTTTTRLVYGIAIAGTSPDRRVLLLGDPLRINAFNTRLRSARGRRFDPVVLHGQPVSWPLVRQQRIWSVVVASEPAGQAAEALLDCKLRGVPILSDSAFQEKYLGRINLNALTANDLLLSPGFAGGKASAAIKRLCDIAVGSAMLVLSLPLMAITAVAVKIDSPGPIFYRQQRVGRFDQTFTLLKFRSMTVDAEAGGQPRWAQKQDPRVTRTGRFIRATRIDELPQLVNVIRGEMSLVGPRPERPHFVEQLGRSIPFYWHRTYVKPGLTGWAQVNFPYGASVEDAREKLSYDLYYVKNRTIILDLSILFSTVRVVLFREGSR